VVIIARKSEFHDDMTKYLQQRRGKKREPFFQNLNAILKPKKEETVVEEEPMFYEEKRSSGGVGPWLRSIFKKRIPDEFEENLTEPQKEELKEMEEEMEELKEAEEMIEEKQESVIKNFLRKLRLFKRVNEVEEEVIGEDVPIIDDEMKETLKMLHLWIEKLPPKTLKQFRDSEDFENYKQILDKYGLIKK
jgi:hypothetical protein